jgi:hypothetical protein
VKEYLPVPFQRALLIPAAICSVLLVVLLVQADDRLFMAIALALPTGLFAWLMQGALRNRKLRVRLHQDGVVVARGAAHDAILFDEVDEVWMVGERKNGILMMTATKLVLTDGTRHVVPLTIQEPTGLYNAISRRCSQSLVPDALRAIAAGETLTTVPHPVVLIRVLKELAPASEEELPSLR